MNKKIKESGFTLIEILVAVIVLALGLLGLAALEANTLRNNQGAYNRSQATQLSYDIADRMRANKTAKDNYLTSNMPIAKAKCTNSAVNLCNDCVGAVNPCSPTKMAEVDLWEWRTALQTLPSGNGIIIENGGVYTVTISWDENKSGFADTQFPMSFRL